MKTSPCLACGAPPPSDAAHIHAVASIKVPGSFVPRGHKGLAGFGAIPLCRKCHEAIHKGKEEEWLEAHVPGGKAYAIGVALRMVLEALHELWEEGEID